MARRTAKPYPGMGPFVVLCAPGDPYRGANSWQKACSYRREISHYPQRCIVSNLPGDGPHELLRHDPELALAEHRAQEAGRPWDGIPE